MSKRNFALVAATFVSIIYGMTFTIAKDVMPQYIGAYGFISLRVGGTMLLFWTTALLMKVCKSTTVASLQREQHSKIKC